MTHNQVVTIARSIELNEIITDGSFEHNHVVDLRNNENGCARPVEENVLNRLKNHFISYDQLAMDLKDSGPCEEIHLRLTVKSFTWLKQAKAMSLSRSRQLKTASQKDLVLWALNFQKFEPIPTPIGLVLFKAASEFSNSHLRLFCILRKFAFTKLTFL